MAYLVLSNGAVFEGQAIGAAGDSVGELVFTTGMTGYLETLTDPSYAGQTVIQTFPLIGNYGVMEEDFEGECAVKGYVVRELCDHPSNFRAQYGLDRFLKDRGVCGICGVDTRELTRILREQGTMNAAICASLHGGAGPLQGRQYPQCRQPQGALRLPRSGREAVLRGPDGLRREAQHYPRSLRPGLRGYGAAL